MFEATQRTFSILPKNLMKNIEIQIFFPLLKTKNSGRRITIAFLNEVPFLRYEKFPDFWIFPISGHFRISGYFRIFLDISVFLDISGFPDVSRFLDISRFFRFLNESGYILCIPTLFWGEQGGQTPLWRLVSPSEKN